MTELLGEFLRIQRHTAQFLRAYQLNRDEKNSAEESKLRVLREDFRFRRDVKIFAAPARFQVLVHDSADGGRSLLNPKERDGVALSAEKLLELGRFESRNEFQIFTLKDSGDKFLWTGFQAFTFMNPQRFLMRKLVSQTQVGSHPHKDQAEEQDGHKQSCGNADHGRTALAR
jgi:hypothetical protein